MQAIFTLNSRSSTRSLLLWLCFAFCFGINLQKADAQQVAFPGAEGAGKYTTGGRGTITVPTTVFEVTKLDDDGSAGTLRWALTQTATYRTIVFRVSGTIHLNSKLNIRANTTIAGQTAPGDGICIADHPVVISGDNVIIRYIRVRMGDKNQKKVDANGNPVDGSGGDDALGALGASNIILDHCSVSWSSDEALTIYRGDNLTIQWCMVSEPLNYSYHWETGDTDYEQHGYGGIWGAKRGSMHHNLIAHCRNRNPRFAGISTYSPATIGVENVDFRNNVIYNWGINTVYGGDGGNYNIVNNYFKAGPNTSSGVRYRICNPSYSDNIDYGKWYVDGNYVEGSSTITADNWAGGVVPQGGAGDLAKVKSTTAFDLGFPLPAQSAIEAYEAVLQGVGCSLPNRDTLDQRIVNNVRTGTGRIIDVQGGYPHGTPYEQTVNAWPALNSSAAPADTDHDGMPDSWEDSNGLDKNNASDRNTYHSSGYTMLEVYLNSLTGAVNNTNPALFVNGVLGNFSQTLGAPSTVQTLLVSGVNLTNNITVTPPANYEVSTDGTTWYNNAQPLVLTQNNGTVATTTLSVRLNASAAGTYNGNILFTSNGATTMSVAVNGTALSSPGSTAGVIGAFPDMDGGFEKQTTGNNTTIGTTAGSHTSTTKWASNASFAISDSVARTGNLYMHFKQESTSNKYVFTPVLTAPTLQASTGYIVQFWYRIPYQLSKNDAGTKDLKISGFSTVNSAVGGNSTAANSTFTSESVIANVNSPFGSNWILFRGKLTSPGDVGGLTYSGVRITYPQNPNFDMDDFVVYPGTAFDETAPDAATAPTTSGNTTENTITVNWSAPATGADGGGYVVVRSTSTTAPTPNANGVYVIGNNMGTGNTVVYTGTATSFTDNGSVTPIAAGNTYYYYIFTADKAFNYSAPVQVTGSLTSVATPAISVNGTLNAFSQTKGNPSATQTYTVSGSNLTGDITITPPANFEVSANGSNWFTSSAPLTLTAANGSVANTTVSVRLNAVAAGSYTGNIVHASSGATAVNLAVSGTTNNPTTQPPVSPDVTVALDGSGQYTTIQAAINAAPTGRTTPYIIYIKNGKYNEKVNIPSNKPYIQLIGESVAGTIISWDSYSGKTENGVIIGTNTSATLTINAADFFIANITVENRTGYTGDGPQALAIYVASDRAAFKNCRFISGQDTVWHNGDGKRHYFNNCYIDGNTDFIFGASTAVFDSCVIFPRDRVDGSNGGYVTAANTPAGQTFGEVFRDCKLTVNRGITFYSLGRPWQNDGGTADKKNNKTVFLNSTMGNSIRPEGWSTWDAGTNTSLITYAEYKTKKFDGTLANVSGRVAWSKQLTDGEAADYYDNSKVFGNWDLTAVSPLLFANTGNEIAISNFRVKKGTSSTPSVLSCNISWPIAGIKYELFKSPDNSSYTKINELTVANDTAVNFAYTDAIPPGGSTYYYFIKASKDGMKTYVTDTILVSSVPTVTVSGNFKPFTQNYGSASTAQLVTVSAVNLIGNVTVTPPANFQVSIDNGTTWNTSAITLTQSSGNVGSTNLLVRLNAAALGSYSDSLIFTSNGAARVGFLLSGTNAIYMAPTSVVLQQWPLTTSGADSVSVRSAGVTASTHTLNKLYPSNGTTLPSVPAYHPVTGFAYAASASGDGFWTTAAGGPGGNLNRTHYVQFTVTASAGYAVKVDSILLSNNIISSSSNTKLAVVYSKSNFASDSANVTGGLVMLPNAEPAPLLSTANGGFTSPIVIANTGSSSTGPTNRYALALNDATGVTIGAGETLTIRLYNSCGSTSAGRYGMLKDVVVKGTATDLNAPPPALTTTGTLNSFSQPLGAPSATQSITLSGTNLTSNVMIIPPANFQLSPDAGTTWYGNVNPLLLAQSGGTLTTTNLLVRLNAAAVGTYSGTITISSNSVTKEIAVSGSTAVPVYPIVATNGTLTNFAQTTGSASAAQTFTVSGSNLTDRILIAAPASYQLSFDGSNWSNNLTITANNGTVAATTIHVRLNASAPGSFTGTIEVTSNGATSKTIAVNGTAVAPPPAMTVTGTLSAFAQTLGAPAAAQTITVAGTNLTGNITITPVAGYEVSVDGASWHNSASQLVINPTNGTIAATTVSIRLNATTAGTYAGNIIVTTNGVTAQNVVVTGTAVQPPVITIVKDLVPFTQTVGTPSMPQSFTVSGTNLTGSVKVSRPADFEISLNGNVWSDSVLTFTPANGSVNANVLVRMRAKAAGSFNGSVTVSTNGLNSESVAVTGTAYSLLTLSPNPAKSFIRVHHPKFYTVATITIYNINGVKVASYYTKSATDKTEMQISGLPAGIYFIEFKGVKDQSVVRFIKE